MKESRAKRIACTHGVNYVDWKAVKNVELAVPPNCAALAP
jgi:hypothetical protein